MKIKKIIFVIIFVVAVVLVLFYLYSEDGSLFREKEPTFLDKLSSLRLKNYSGEIVDWGSFKGKTLVVNSWASWCPFCADEFRAFSEIQEEFDGVIVVMVNRAESKTEAESFSDGFNLQNDIVLVLDPEDSFYKMVEGFAMPETIFLDKDGVIRFHKRGPMDIEEIRTKTGELF